MKIVTWAMVHPRLQAEKAAIKEALTITSPENLLTLQARHEALSQVERWFHVAAIDEPIFDEAI